MDGCVRPLALAAALAGLLAPRALAQSTDIQGNALTITATDGQRSATLTIPRTSLSLRCATREWAWSSSSTVPFTAPDGAILGTFSGSISFDPTFDNILLALDLTAGSTTTRFTARTADLANSQAWPGASFMGSAHLYDRSDDGATLTGMFAGRCAQLAWDRAPQATVLPGLSVAPGADAASVEPIILSSPFTGRESISVDLTLTPHDLVATTFSSIVSVPAPSTAALTVCAILALTRRRRRPPLR